MTTLGKWEEAEVRSPALPPGKRSSIPEREREKPQLIMPLQLTGRRNTLAEEGNDAQIRCSGDEKNFLVSQTGQIATKEGVTALLGQKKD